MPKPKLKTQKEGLESKKDGKKKDGPMNKSVINIWVGYNGGLENDLENKITRIIVCLFFSFFSPFSERRGGFKINQTCMRPHEAFL